MELVKPVKTRWNSYYAAFERAVKLQGPLSAYTNMKLKEYRRTEAAAALRSAGRRTRRPGGCKQIVNLLPTLGTITANSCSNNLDYSYAKTALTEVTGLQLLSI
ncbi:hypothetical protein EJ02DRAFT_414952 [Clathrospora elynae]|uniref:Uncharacterized protein n=1 Tax=Clathrospora elynae TaxID=706981 RepID=A0A6A5S8P5_9PLEO|nr:hypothetical protein EJ02DRAFT_414952 [Clathrospora elynae]